MKNGFLISLHKVSYFYYNNKHQEVGISDVSLKLMPKHKYLILGESGSGKTTLLDILCGDLEPSKGNVIYDGVKRDEIFRLSKDIVFRNESLLSNALYYEEDEDVIDELLSKLGIADLKHVRIKQLSGGEKDMAMLALALLSKTKLIVMDEPFANIDVEHAKKIIKVIQEIQDKCFVIVTQRPDLFNQAQYDCIVIEDKQIQSITLAKERKETQIEEQVQILPQPIIRRRLRKDTHHFVSLVLSLILMVLSVVIGTMNAKGSVMYDFKLQTPTKVLLYKDNAQPFSLSEINSIKNNYGATSVTNNRVFAQNDTKPTTSNNIYRKETIKIANDFYYDFDMEEQFNARIEKITLLRGSFPDKPNEVAVTSAFPYKIGDVINLDYSLDEFKTQVSLTVKVVGEVDEFWAEEDYRYNKTLLFTKSFYSTDEIFSLNDSFQPFEYRFNGRKLGKVYDNFADFDPQNPTVQTVLIDADTFGVNIDFDKTYEMEVFYINKGVMDFTIPFKFVNSDNYEFFNIANSEDNIFATVNGNPTRTFAIPTASSLRVMFDVGNEKGLFDLVHDFSSCHYQIQPRRIIEVSPKVAALDTFVVESDEINVGENFELINVPLVEKYSTLAIFMIIEIVILLYCVIITLHNGQRKSMWKELEEVVKVKKNYLDMILLCSTLVCLVITSIMILCLLPSLFILHNLILSFLPLTVLISLIGYKILLLKKRGMASAANT